MRREVAKPFSTVRGFSRSSAAPPKSREVVNSEFGIAEAPVDDNAVSQALSCRGGVSAPIRLRRGRDRRRKRADIVSRAYALGSGVGCRAHSESVGNQVVDGPDRNQANQVY